MVTGELGQSLKGRADDGAALQVDRSFPCVAGKAGFEHRRSNHARADAHSPLAVSLSIDCHRHSLSDIDLDLTSSPSALLPTLLEGHAMSMTASEARQVRHLAKNIQQPSSQP